MPKPRRLDRFDLVDVICTVCKKQYQKYKYLEEHRIHLHQLPSCSRKCSGKLGGKRGQVRRNRRIVQKQNEG